MYIKFYILAFSLLQYFCYAYKLPFEIGNSISRRQLILGVANICIMPKAAVSDDNNRPLTTEEMEEYKRLLKDAERIKNIIKINKETFENEFDNFNKTLK